MKSLSCQGVFNVFPCAQTNCTNAATRAEVLDGRGKSAAKLGLGLWASWSTKSYYIESRKAGSKDFFYLTFNSCSYRPISLGQQSSFAWNKGTYCTLLVMSSWTVSMGLISMVIVVVSFTRIKPPVSFYSLWMQVLRRVIDGKNKDLAGKHPLFWTSTARC